MPLSSRDRRALRVGAIALGVGCVASLPRVLGTLSRSYEAKADSLYAVSRAQQSPAEQQTREREHAALSDQLDALEQQLLPARSGAELAGRLRDALLMGGSSAGLSVSSLVAEPDSADLSGYTAARASLDATGPFTAIARFLALLDAIPGLPVITAMEIGRTDQGAGPVAGPPNLRLSLHITALGHRPRAHPEKREE